LRGREKAIENNPSVPNDRATAVDHSEDLSTAAPKTNTGFYISESASEKIIPDGGDRHNEGDHVSRFGLDFRQRMKQTNSGAIATDAKDAAAKHLKASVAVAPSSDQNQPFNDQAARDVDAKAGLSRGAAIKTPTSETGTFSSEAEKDAHDFKDSGPRINSADGFTREDAGDRANRVIPENGDKASPFSNNRVSESFSETASSAKDPDPAANFSRTGTLSQIVERATFHLKNGQSELRLNLKPDFLGQIHMRIVTENQQVTLKISTEFAAVKEIIENNIHQLKADLQNHGLEINSLDVSVTKDSHQQGSGHHPADLHKANSDAGDKSGKDDRVQTELPDANAFGEEHGSDNAIDYFV
jgi:flagellar hook-length control protein FliK